MEISKVGLTKFPRIGRLNGESIEIKPSKLLFVGVEECECLTSLEGSLLLQIQYIRSIHVLRISDCRELQSAPFSFEEMSELRELDIRNCPKPRTSREIQGKILSPSLGKLTIKQSGELEQSLIKSLHGLANLSELLLENCPGLVSLPSADVCKSLKSLKFMEIIGCGNLSFVWRARLPSAPDISENQELQQTRRSWLVSYSTCICSCHRCCSC
uniref:Disease resistance protein At4g27190-like leucine-rich repeats domain-containing protein n=1 Tax=Arundo donax TaxID=35708 RepID=A0A0A9E7T4_ARUDO